MKYIFCCYISTFRNVCSVQYGCFCNLLISYFADMLLIYSLCDFEMLPVSPINLLKTTRRLLYLKTQFVPLSKHSPPRL